MKFIISIISLSILASCSGGGGGASESTDPIYGDWYYQAPGGTSTQAKGIVATISKDGTVKFANVYLYASGGSAVAYTRKSLGTFVRNGNEFTVTYSYETCDPVGTEKLTIETSGEKLIVSAPNSGLTLTMSRPSGTSTIQTMAAIEDKNCNILSKLESDQKRSVASAKSKSFFDRIIK